MNTKNNTNNTCKVHFALNDETDSQSAPHQELTAEMINDMWYTPQHIDYFKQSAKYAILNREKLGEEQPGEEFSMAGLERYIGKRSEYKRSAQYYILHAQKKSRDPEFIRAVSRRCTAWARSIAAQQGSEDYCDVYDPLSGLLADPCVSVEILKVTNGLEKRSLPTLEDEQPTKRQRVC